MKILFNAQASTRALNVVPVMIEPKKIVTYRGNQFKMAYYATKFYEGDYDERRRVYNLA